MSDPKAKAPAAPSEPPPTAYVGTVKVNIHGKDYFVHITPPPPGLPVEELKKALDRNREILKQSQEAFRKASEDQHIRYIPLARINYETPTQNAIMAHLHISILIPLINMRGGDASFDKPETLPAKTRIEFMRTTAEKSAQMAMVTALYQPNQSISKSFRHAALILMAIVIFLLIVLR